MNIKDQVLSYRLKKYREDNVNSIIGINVNKGEKKKEIDKVKR